MILLIQGDETPFIWYTREKRQVVIFHPVIVTSVNMIFSVPLTWKYLLSIFTYHVVAQTLMVTGSDFDSTLATNTVDTPHRITQGCFAKSCSSSKEKYSSVGHGITTSSDEATRYLNSTQILHTSFNIAIGVTAVNVHLPVTETLVPFDGVDHTTADSNKTSTVLTQRAADVFQNYTTLFSGDASDITRANNLSTDYNRNSTDISSLLRNDCFQFHTQLNATNSARNS